jgi:hypothetical protein
MKRMNRFGITCFSDVSIDGVLQWLENPIIQALIYPGIVAFSETDQTIIQYELLKQLIVDAVQVLPVTYTFLNDGTSYENTPLYKGPDNRAYWVRMGWMYYFGADLVAFIGEEKFEGLKTYHEKIRLKDGYLIALTEAPFDIENADHRERQQQALHELGMDAFAEKYPVDSRRG